MSSGGCKTCEAGYICYGCHLEDLAGEPCTRGTTKRFPTDVETDKGYACPRGTYCPAGTLEPLLCPVGTYQPNIAAKSAEDCLPCMENTFADEEA